MGRAPGAGERVVWGGHASQGKRQPLKAEAAGPLPWRVDGARKQHVVPVNPNSPLCLLSSRAAFEG